MGLINWMMERETGMVSHNGLQDTLYRLVYSSFDVQKFWDPQTECLSHHHGAIFNFDFSTDSSTLVAACENGSFLVFDPNNYKLVKAEYRAHTDCVNCVRFLDTRSFVTCSDDCTVALWDLRFLSHMVRIFKGHKNWVKNVEYASSVGLLVTAGLDGSIFSWDINNYSPTEHGKQIFTMKNLMRCKLVPDDSKMVMTSSVGTMMILHDLDLLTLDLDLQSYISFDEAFQLAEFRKILTRPKNRLEIINEFPSEPDIVASLQVHPQGWCVASRYTTKTTNAEWTCLHDIQSKPTVMDDECRSDSHCARTYPPLYLSTRRSNQHLSCHRQSSSLFTLDQHQPGLSAEIVEDSEASGQGPSRSDSCCPDISPGEYAEGRFDVRPHLNVFKRTNQSARLCLRYLRSAHRIGYDSHSTRHGLDHNRSTTRGTAVSPEGIIPPHLSLRRQTPSAFCLNGNRLRQRCPFGARPPPRRYQSMPRLLHCHEELAVAQGFIKELCWSSDGRFVASPWANRVRLFAFNDRSHQLCQGSLGATGDASPLQKIHQIGLHPAAVLGTRFSPTQPLVVTGSLDGSVAFLTPQP